MTAPALAPVQGIIFDKDGTLFDFNATWGAWAHALLHAEAGDDPALLARLAAALGYDLAQRCFVPGSIVIAATVDEVADAMLPLLPVVDKAALIVRMKAGSLDVPQIAAAPLGPLFDQLQAMGLRLGVATNDAEGPARAHLARAGLQDRCDFIAGYDSGFGAKPAPGQLLAFCAQTGLAPAACVMVGDSLHDLHAGRAAGMRTIGVLTGPATRSALAPHADAVLPDIGHLPGWLAGL